MPKPVSPVIPGASLPEVVIAKDQPPYKPLPAYVDKDITLSRWHLTWKERLHALCTGDVYLWVSTAGRPLQPVMLQIEKPGITQ